MLRLETHVAGELLGVGRLYPDHLAERRVARDGHEHRLGHVELLRHGGDRVALGVLAGLVVSALCHGEVGSGNGI